MILLSKRLTFLASILLLSMKHGGGRNLSFDFQWNYVVRNGYFLRKLKKSKLCKENTALFKVLTSWCIYHQQQIMSMLKFLKEEQESCSQICHSFSQSKSALEASRTPNTSLPTCRVCTNQKCTKIIQINQKTRKFNLPYLTVCLKDLRFTWPNLNLGTVKLNLDKNVHDQLLNCINTQESKEWKNIACYNCLNSHHPTSQSKLSFSSLTKLKAQKTVTELERTMLKCRCQLEMLNNYCQTKGDTTAANYMTVLENLTLKESGAKEKQNSQRSEISDTPKISVGSSTSSCVNFGSLIKRFLNTDTNGFAEMLNHKENCLRKNGVQTEIHRNNEKTWIFDNSLPDNQRVDFASDLNNLTDTFPKEKISFLKNSRNSTEDRISIKDHAHDVLVLKSCESTETESSFQETITHLPHDTLKVTCTNVNRNNSWQTLPANIKHSVNEKRRENKRHTAQDVQLECTIPPKRYSRNILGKCRLCDMSHGLCSFQDNINLFCRCTIQKNSGILKNFKAGGVKFRHANEKTRNTHLKVVVERLEDSILSAKNKDVCQSKDTNLCNGNVESSSCVLSVPQKTPNDVKQSNCLSPTLLEETDCEVVEKTQQTVNKATTTATSADKLYFSPIKLMFVSKVESEDGVKYTLSHTCTPNSIQNRVSKSMALLSQPECNSTPQNNPGNMSPRSNECQLKRKTAKCKTFACPVSKRIKRSNKWKHKKYLQRTFGKTGCDFSFCPHKNTKCNKYYSSRLKKPRIAATYVVQNRGSDTQLRIKKVERFLRSSERNSHKCKSQSINSGIISIRLKKLRKLSNVSGKCRTNTSISHEERQALQAITKHTEKGATDQAEEYANQKTVINKKWARGSLRKRKLLCSDPKTRSRKAVATSFTAVSSSNFLVRRALRHKTKFHLNRCKAYRKRLRSYKPESKTNFNSRGNKDEKCNIENINSQPNTVLKWWSTSTSKESLLKDFEKKYEQIANTWLGENKGDKHHEVQSLSTLKFCSSETRSPVQKLFQKKCDMSDLAYWFMQTTETQSLSIVRKANARSPRLKISRKGPSTKPKKPSVNSCRSKKQKCAPPEILTILPGVLNRTKGNWKVGSSPTNLESANDQIQEVCVKFACPEKHVTKTCPLKASTISGRSAQQITKSSSISNNVKSDSCQGSTTTTSSIKNIDSFGSSSKKHKKLERNKTKSTVKNLYTYCSSKQNVRDCKVFLTKLKSVERNMSCSFRDSGNALKGNKSTLHSEWRLKRGFTTKYCLRMNRSLARATCTLSRIKNSTGENRHFRMCLRKSKESDESHTSRSKSVILERRKKLSKMTLYIGRNKTKCKQVPAMETIHSECTRVQLGPIKPVGIPTLRELSSKDGTYSLAPIRIPLQ